MPEADADADAEMTDEIAAAARGLPAAPTGPSDPPPAAFRTRHSGLRRCGLVHWLAASLLFGLVDGPLIALAVNHAHPHLAVAAIVAAPLVVVAGFFFLAGLVFLHWSWGAAPSKCSTT